MPTTTTTLGRTAAAKPTDTRFSGRLVSLDFFRGITIAAMILVNNPGDWKATYWPLRHAEWNGWTAADLVFPFFLFIVGVSLVFSFAGRLARGQSRRQLMGHVFRRGAILFVLGLFINGFPFHFDPRTLRIEGVLQRIALCYVIASALYLWTGRRTCIAAIFTCLAGYWVLMRFVPVPGFGIPGQDVPFLDPNRNLTAWLDRRLLAGHLYNGTHDPEGLLSTIPAVASTLVGIVTGEWLRCRRSARQKAVWMLICGILGIIAGQLLHPWFPINKNLWTSSFVVLTSGLALLFLALSYWLIDVLKVSGRWMNPALVFGMNAIAGYVFSEVLGLGLYAWRVHFVMYGTTSMQEYVYRGLFSQLASPPNASLLYSIGFVLICWIPMWLLYRKGVFLKI